MHLSWRYVVLEAVLLWTRIPDSKAVWTGRTKVQTPGFCSAVLNWCGFQCTHAWPVALVWRFCDNSGVIPLQFITCKCLEFWSLPWSSLQGQSALKFISFFFIFSVQKEPNSVLPLEWEQSEYQHSDPVVFFVTWARKGMTISCCWLCKAIKYSLICGFFAAQ